MFYCWYDLPKWFSYFTIFSESVSKNWCDFFKDESSFSLILVWASSINFRSGVGYQCWDNGAQFEFCNILVAVMCAHTLFTHRKTCKSLFTLVNPSMNNLAYSHIYITYTVYNFCSCIDSNRLSGIRNVQNN